MTKFLIPILFFFVNVIVFASPMREPENFENCISSHIDGDSLIIYVKTNRDPSEYSLHTVFLYRHGDDKMQTIGNLSASILVKDNVFLIKVSTSLIRYEYYSISVLLNNEKKGRGEFYRS